MDGQQISPDLMRMMQGGSEGNMPPASTPDMRPQPNEGERMQAQGKVQMAMTVLEQALVAFGAGTDEGKAVLNALKALGHKFGTEREKGRDLIPSEVMNLVGSMPGQQAGGSPMMPPPGGGGMQPPGAGGGMPPGMA